MVAHHEQAGYTLIELLLTLAVMTIVIGLSLPLSQSFNNSSELDITTQSVADVLRRAEEYADASKGDSPWGVKILADSIVVFQGSTYATRTTTLDETIPIPNSVDTGGSTDIIFAKFTGNPTALSSVTLSSTGSATRTVTVNAKGLVSY